MNYLQLTNKVIQESGYEQDDLTLASWTTAETGRKTYTRYKRAVSEAWKMIQMERNEWEFKSEQIDVRVNPRLRFSNANGDALDFTPGASFVGQQSNTEITLVSFELDPSSPATTTGQAVGELEFTVADQGKSIVRGEEFLNVALGASFTYRDKGSYNFFPASDGKREPRWDTFVVGNGTAYPIPVAYVPWANWTYKTYSFVGTSQSVPTFFSQDPKGNLVFYPQPLDSFDLNFWYDEEPQALVLPEDIPEELPGEYHEWIAWRALMSIARYDKNPDLFAYANEHVTFYKNRAERHLMPIPSFEDSRFNRGVLP